MMSYLSCGLILQDLDASLQNLTAQFERATAEKISCQTEVTHTNQTIELANRLVKGLEVNNEREEEEEEFGGVMGLTWHKVNCQFVGGMHGEALVIELHQQSGLEVVMSWHDSLTVV